MGRFIRRVFVLLILFTIIFLVYRYINPEWASVFVDKVQSVKNSLFQKDNKKDLEDKNNLVITWETTFITWDNINNDQELDFQTWEEDLTWLEELNQEIEWIISSWQSKDEQTDDLIDCISYFDWCNTCKVVSWDLVWCTRKFCQDYEEAKCVKYISSEIIDSTKEDNDTKEQTNWEQTWSNVWQEQEDNKIQENQDSQWLSDSDYEQMKDAFGPVVE